MKMTISALTAAFLVATMGAASAAHAPLHHQQPASAYSAFSPDARQDVPYAPNWGFGAGGDDESHQTATGGPVGGIN